MIPQEDQQREIVEKQVFVLKDNEPEDFFKAHFSTIIPAVLTLIGIMISLVHLYNEDLKLDYERAKGFSLENRETLNNLVKFMSLFPPSPEEPLEWKAFGKDDKTKKQKLQNDFNSAYKLYGEPVIPKQFSELKLENPDVYSSSKPKLTSAEEDIQYYKSKYYDIVNSANFTHTLSMFQFAIECLDNGDCDEVVICGFLAPVFTIYSDLSSRYKPTVFKWRTEKQHPGQIKFDNFIEKAMNACSRR